MGTCYSCQARIGKSTYPSDMSLTSNTSSKKGAHHHRPSSNAFIQPDKSIAARQHQLRPSTSSATSAAARAASSRQSPSSSIEHLNSSADSGVLLTVDPAQPRTRRAQNGNQRRTEPDSTASTSGNGGGRGLPAGRGIPVPGRARFGFQQHQKKTVVNNNKPAAGSGPGAQPRADANRNLLGASSDSIDSVDSKYSSGSLGRRNRFNNRNNPPPAAASAAAASSSPSPTNAYNPRVGARWRMIDDSESTTTDSKSVSTPEAECDRNGNALGAIKVSPTSSSGQTGSSSRLTSRLKPTFQKPTERQWVKAGALEVGTGRHLVEEKTPSANQAIMAEPQRPTNETTRPTPSSNAASQPNPAGSESGTGKKRRGFFSRGRGHLQMVGRRGNTQKSEDTASSTGSGGGSGDACPVSEEISRTVESMLHAASDSKGVKDTINVLSKDIATVSLTDDDVDVSVTRRDTKQDGGEGDVEEDGESEPDSAPLARLDSIDSGSMSSLNSDDLMLETDITDECYVSQSTASLERALLAGGSGSTVAASGGSTSRMRPQGLSQSQPASGLAKLDKRPFMRRPTDGPAGAGPSAAGGVIGGGYWRQNSLKGADGPRERRLRSQSSTNEAVSELSSMMAPGASTGAAGSAVPPPTIQRRPPKFSRERPASFPGPLSSDAVAASPPAGGARTERTFQFRQRGKLPSIGDEEQVLVEANAYRVLMQELTDCKTMLFKLKRVIQQEEIGSPFGNSTFAGTLKNGYKFSSGTSSTPGSPLVTVDAVAGFTFSEPGESQTAEVLQENNDLRQQLQAAQRQLEERDRTIKLLQQQMTKYECGHYGLEGKVYTNATTQTDKPRLAVSKSLLRSPTKGGLQGNVGGGGGGGGSSAATGDTVISSRRTSLPKEANATDQESHGAGANAEKMARPRSQLPVGGSGGTRNARNATSRLPAMRFQRPNKAQGQLQSFSKIAQAQQAN